MAKNEAKTHPESFRDYEKLKIEKANPREIRAVTHAHPLAVLLLECLLDIHSASAEIVRSLADFPYRHRHIFDFINAFKIRPIRPALGNLISLLAHLRHNLLINKSK